MERTFREVGLPLWVERVGGLPDFYVTPDFGFTGIHKALPNRLAYWDVESDLAETAIPEANVVIKPPLKMPGKHSWEVASMTEDDSKGTA